MEQQQEKRHTAWLSNIRNYVQHSSLVVTCLFPQFHTLPATGGSSRNLFLNYSIEHVKIKSFYLKVVPTYFQYVISQHREGNLKRKLLGLHLNIGGDIICKAIYRCQFSFLYLKILVISQQDLVSGPKCLQSFFPGAFSVRLSCLHTLAFQATGMPQCEWPVSQ